MSLSLDPNWPHHSFTLFPIDLCSNLAVYPIASLSHSIHLLAVCAIFSWCVCQGLLCYISIPLCLSKSLRGTYAQSNRSHHYIHVPSYRTYPSPHFSSYTSGCIDKNIHQYLSVSHTQTFVLTYKGAFCEASVHFSLVPVFVLAHPSVSVCLSLITSSVCFQDYVLLFAFHLYCCAGPRSTASLSQQQKAVPFHQGAY